MKNDLKAVAAAVLVLGAALTGSAACAALPAGLEAAAAGIAASADSGDTARAEALLAGLFGGEAAAVSAEPVRFSGAPAYEPARASAPRAAGLKAAPMPALPGRAEFNKSAADDLGVTAEAKDGEVKAEEAGEAGEAKEDGGDAAQSYASDEGTLFGACMAGLLGIAIVVGLILLFPAGALLLV